MTMTPREAMTPRGQPRIGCLGSVLGLAAFVAIVVAAIFAGLIVLGIVAALVVIGLIALAVDRLLLAISPRRRERRANLQRSFIVWGVGRPTPPGQVIDTTARFKDPRHHPGSGDTTD
jgi:hypothetical protein